MKTMIVMYVAMAYLLGCDGPSETKAQRDARHALDCVDAYIHLREINDCYADDVCRRGYDVINKLANDEIHYRSTVEFLHCPPPKQIEWIKP